jgi:phage-Barnase-EndoU-ColicinE5/D-RelE like nuclease3
VIGLVLVQKASEVYAGCLLEKLPAGWFDWARTSQLAGVTLTGYRAIADTHAMQHSLKNHGIPAEVKRGQKMILPSDFSHLPEMLAHPERLDQLGFTKAGRLVLGFEKEIDGWCFRAAMEVRSGRKELALVSFYTVGKNKA